MSVFPKATQELGHGLSVKYFSGIAPTLGKTEYGTLMSEFEKTGKLPMRLKIKGLALDDTANANGWKVAVDSLDMVAKQLNEGVEIRKDHSNKIDDIIGKTTKGWREGNQVLYEGEIADRAVIEKILLGYIKFDSIQVIAPDVFCLQCLEVDKRDKDDSRIDLMDEPCPRCGSFALFIENPITLEMSLVTMPAYANAETEPIGFKASMDLALAGRMKRMLNLKSTIITNTESPNTGGSNTGKPDTATPKPEPYQLKSLPQNAWSEVLPQNDKPAPAKPEEEEAVEQAMVASQMVLLEASVATAEVLIKQTLARAKDVISQ